MRPASRHADFDERDANELTPSIPPAYNQRLVDATRPTEHRRAGSVPMLAVAPEAPPPLPAMLGIAPPPLVVTPSGSFTPPPVSGVREPTSYPSAPSAPNSTRSQSGMLAARSHASIPVAKVSGPASHPSLPSMGGGGAPGESGGAARSRAGETELPLLERASVVGVLAFLIALALGMVLVAVLLWLRLRGT